MPVTADISSLVRGFRLKPFKGSFPSSFRRFSMSRLMSLRRELISVDNVFMSDLRAVLRPSLGTLKNWWERQAQTVFGALLSFSRFKASWDFLRFISYSLHFSWELTTFSAAASSSSRSRNNFANRALSIAGHTSADITYHSRTLPLQRLEIKCPWKTTSFLNCPEPLTSSSCPAFWLLCPYLDRIYLISVI